jgi:hypothetical protein
MNLRVILASLVHETHTFGPDKIIAAVYCTLLGVVLATVGAPDERMKTP